MCNARMQAVLGVIVAGAAACHADGSGGGAASQGGIAGDEVVVALCGRIDWCADGWGRLVMDPNRCLEGVAFTWMEGCEPLVFANSQAEVDACVADIRAMTCRDMYDLGDAAFFLPLLSTPFAKPASCMRLRPLGSGVLPVVGRGASCEHAKCQPGDYCKRPASTGVTRTCRVCAERISEGSLCDRPGPIGTGCASGLYCGPADQLCRQRAAAGAPCASSFECLSGWCDATSHCATRLPRDAACVSGDRCAGALVCISDICTDRGGEGATCTTDNECMWDFYCDTTVGQCTPAKLCEAGIGEVCRFDNACVATAFCAGTPPTCVPRLDASQPCDDPMQCAEPLVCQFVPPTCEPRAAAGEACGASYGCEAGLYCEERSMAPTCEVLKADGEPCARDYECVSDSCGSTTSPPTCDAACVMP